MPLYAVKIRTKDSNVIWASEESQLDLNEIQSREPWVTFAVFGRSDQIHIAEGNTQVRDNAILALPETGDENDAFAFGGGSSGWEAAIRPLERYLYVGALVIDSTGVIPDPGRITFLGQGVTVGRSPYDLLWGMEDRSWGIPGEIAFPGKHIPTQYDDAERVHEFLGGLGSTVLALVLRLIERAAANYSWADLHGLEVRPYRDPEIPNWEYVVITLVFASSFEEADNHLLKLYGELDELNNSLSEQEQTILREKLSFDVESNFAVSTT